MAWNNNIPQMKWEGELSENFRLYKAKMELYFEDENIAEDEKKARKILRTIGDDGIRKLYGCELSDDDKKDPDKLFTFFESQIPSTKCNFRVHRLQLSRFTFNTGENVDSFVTRIRQHAQKCELDVNELSERIVELVIASTPISDFQKELLAKPKGFTVKELLECGRKYEALIEGNLQIQNLDNSDKVDAIRKSKLHPCTYCGTTHKKRECPAYDSTCDQCGKKGHWRSVCRSNPNMKKKKSVHKPPRGRSKSHHRGPHKSTKTESHEYRKPQRSQVHHASEEYFETLDSVVHNIESNESEVYQTLKISPPSSTKDYNIRLKLDTGASCNTIPHRMIKQIYKSDEHAKRSIETEQVKLTAYNGKGINYKGTIYMNLHSKGRIHRCKFYIIDVAGYKAPAILGLKTCKDLNLITINLIENKPKVVEPVTNLESIVSTFPKCFDRIGEFEGEIKLNLKDDAIPYIAPPRKCSIHMKDKIRDELQNMVKKGIIKEVHEHTDWCSNVCFVTKQDGSLRVCLDPKKLNENLKRCPHKIPTTEEMNPLFSGAKFFSKLDAKAGYWSVKLDPQSQLLTTFRSPLGQRYCFLRLPFGLNVSQDDFQRKIDQILENLPGVAGIADDICVTGSTEAEHDENLLRLMKRAEDKGLVFNSSKCVIKQTEISFFGNIYTREGIKPDPKKVEHIRNMPTPESKDELRRFLGMITYLSQFIPKFSNKTNTLRELLKESAYWCWEEEHEKCFIALKKEISDQSMLHYFDTSKDTVLEADASIKGLGSALIQDGKPIAFASKALTETQTRYSNIEREMLAIVAGCERYHTFLYGKSFTIITDHQPLVTICNKPIHSAPARLQRMLLRIQGYNYRIIYRPGSQMIIADALSRLPDPKTRSDVDLDERIDNIDIDIDAEKLCNIALINFGQEKKKSIIEETLNDPDLATLKEVVINGWPNTIKDLPEKIRSYWSYREEIGVEAGVLFKGRQVIIPDSMRSEILKSLHKSHQGIEKTRLLAKETCFWPRINKDIEKRCKECPLCQEFQHMNQQEPMQAYEIPSRPWQYIGTDLFEIDGKHFLIIADKYSKFPLVDEVTANKTSKGVTDAVSRYCAIFGRPEKIFSDNGPQYSGKAFQDFINQWGISHVTSSPTYSQSNGFIERQIGHIKPLLEKTIRNNDDIQLTLMNIRATPISHRLKSPAELLLNRPITTLLPSHQEVGDESDRDELHCRRDTMLNQNKTGNILSTLHPGQFVRVLSHQNKRWFPGTVVREAETPQSYIIRSNNRTIRRNRHHLREAISPSAVSGSNNVSPATSNSSANTSQAHDCSIQQTPVRPIVSTEPRRSTPKQLFQSDKSKSVTVTFADPPDECINTQSKDLVPKVKSKPASSNDSSDVTQTSRYGRIINKNPKYI